jgi:hypothetical protein
MDVIVKAATPVDPSDQQTMSLIARFSTSTAVRVLTEIIANRNAWDTLGSNCGAPYMTNKYTFETHGFEEISASEGMTNAAAYTKECSGARSDCCTRTCSADATFVASDEDWAKFLDVRGGQIQY